MADLKMVIIMSRNCHWDETTIIDYIEGQLPREEAARVQAHIEGCLDCRTTYEEWRGIIDQSADESVQPPKGMKHHLMKVIKATAPKKEHVSFYKHPGLATMAVCAALAIVFAVGLITYQQPQPSSQQVARSLQTPTMQAYDEVTYVSVHQQEVNGYVWMNPASHELVVFLQGLQQRHPGDYQVWLVSKNTQAHRAGVMKMAGDRAQLYVRRPSLQHIEHIVVLFQPDGEQHIPVAQRRYIIELQRP